jgi:predicted amidohydrolase YtcJ
MGSTADTLFVNGQVFTAPATEPITAGVAVRGGRITAVGPDDELREFVGTSTEVVDLAGGLLIPGFQDAHVHPVMGGVDLLRCDLHDALSADEALARVATYAAGNPDLEWIVGGGWWMAHYAGGTPTREALDAVVPDRPVFLTNKDGHGSWVNSRALELAGINASTPDPADGRIERRPDGSPSGTLHEGAALLVARLLPGITDEQQVAGLLLAQELLFSLGITSWQDAAVGELFGHEDVLQAYLTAAEDGLLRARVVGALWWDRERGAEQIVELEDRRARGQVGRFRASSVKIMQDGVVENFTAGMLEPYLDGCGCSTGNAGLSFVDPEELPRHVTELDARGFQVHFHALGDRAVREALDALEAARAANGPSDGRHHLAHLQVVHPDDIPRFAQLGAIANIQPLWAAHEPQMDELTIPFLGEQRSSLQYPFADLVKAGARLAAGSDWSVSSPDPLAGIHVAVNRVAPGAEGAEAEPLYAHNRISLATALTAYTAGSAYVNHHEDATGRIGVGRLADLVVLDRDPFAGPPEQIADTTVVSTYVDGELVYSRS